MADDRVKWIKITTDMFDDEKIDFITSLPEADAIIVIWVRLLSLAGKCNAGGYIYLTEKIPYTEDMLSHKFRKPINIIKLALDTFQRLGMIEYDDGIIFVTNWVKHQNVEGLDKIRERDRERKRIERLNKKQLLIEDEASMDVSKDSPEKIHGCPQTDIDIDKEVDIDKDTKVLSGKKFKEPSVEDVTAYCRERNNSVDPVKWHDFYSSKGWMVGRNKMKDWKAAVRTWEHNNKSGGQAIGFNQKPSGAIASGEAEADEEWPISNAFTR